MARNRIKFNRKGWDEIVEHVIDTEGVARMQRVADASNANLDRPGYKVSAEGDKRLRKRNYRATVITATEDAMYDNAKNQTLIRNLPAAGGA
jgi:hypothetical protein